MTDLRPFIFDNLPRELRDSIYGHLVIKELTACAANALGEVLCERSPGGDAENQPRKLDLVDEELELDPSSLLKGYGLSRLKRYGLSTSIMATSHRIHDEVSAVLYGRNRFRWCIYGDTLQRSAWKDSHNNLDLPAKYLRHLTRIHFVVNFMGDAHPSDPEGNRRTIALTRVRLRRCCVALLPNRLRDVKVTYIDFFATAHRFATDVNHPFLLTPFLVTLAIPPEPRMRQTILEPLKLLKGVGKATFVFDGRVSPEYALELEDAMTAPKAGSSAAEEAGTKDKTAVDEHVAERPASTV